MGEIAEMMIDGTLCQFCGEYLEDGAPGYPRSCKRCERVENKLKEKRRDRDKSSSNNKRQR